MTTKAPAAAAVGKKTAPRKAAASKTAAVAAETVEDKVVAPAKKRAARKPTVEPVALPKAELELATPVTGSPTIHPDQRHQLIELAAYYISERRGFGAASSDEDWLQAEQEVDAMIAAGQYTV